MKQVIISDFNLSEYTVYRTTALFDKLGFANVKMLNSDRCIVELCDSDALILELLGGPNYVWTTLFPNIFKDGE